MISDDKKETLTSENIIKDIKEKYKRKTKENVFMSILLFVFMIISFSFVEFKLEFRFLLCDAILLILILLNVMSIYFLIKNIGIIMRKEIKYSVFVDRFVGTSNKRIGKYVIPCMNFEKYGNFELHNRQSYYSWSKLCAMNNDNLKRSACKEDLFYLVIINEKIEYLYNQKFFELKEV